jgi:hypothetical protein
MGVKGGCRSNGAYMQLSSVAGLWNIALQASCRICHVAFHRPPAPVLLSLTKSMSHLPVMCPKGDASLVSETLPTFTVTCLHTSVCVSIPATLSLL